jgi:hypothetical protein
MYDDIKLRKLTGIMPCKLFLTTWILVFLIDYVETFLSVSTLYVKETSDLVKELVSFI